MNDLITTMTKKGPVVTDGSWGTQLQRRGLKRGECPDSLNLSNPAMVKEVAQCYVNAGSGIILTNTFSANRFVLSKFGLEARASEINRAGVAISKEAAGTKSLVFSSIGPSGKMLVSGDVTEEQLREAFEEQAEAQRAAGADGIIVETMMDVVEARIAVAAAKRTGLPVVGSMVFDSGKDKTRTMMGNTPEQAVQELAQAGADAVGANCGQGIEGFIVICGRMKAATDLPLWMKPNAGLPEMEGGEVVYRTSPQEFARHVPPLVEAGALFIGGCCGTSEEYIREIIRALGR
ncbi:MAG: homocysteine S-methyltransferase family protein [Spirochaetes bacterium]|nr:homocysteine S-methyltransferase family protein [Spirochaetota bacterium]